MNIKEKQQKVVRVLKKVTEQVIVNRNDGPPVAGSKIKELFSELAKLTKK